MLKSHDQPYLSTRWVKIARDFWIAKGRVAMMVLAIAAGVFAVTTILGGYTILTREVSRNYQSTNPASASLEVDNLDEATLTAVRARPGIAAAEARATLRARIEVQKDFWLPATLFVIQDFKAMQLSRFSYESGAISPPDGTMLLEREALKLINAKNGDQTKLKTKDGVQHTLTISGVVHDPSLAPAWQEQTAYAYITPATLQLISGVEKLTTLKILVKDEAGKLSYDQKQIDATVSQLASWLKVEGHTIKSIQVPPPGKHPHQGMMTGVLLLLLTFSFTALVLGAILTATMINSMLAQQVRQIGVMKTIGAGTWQIARLYLGFILLVGVIATAIGLPLGVVAANRLAEVGIQLFNISLQSTAIPAWAYLVALLSGIAIPLLLAFFPIFQATRITVREAISEFGTQRTSTKHGWINRSLSRIPGLDRSFLLAIRNTFRRRGRLVMTLVLLATAGSLFIGTMSAKSVLENELLEAAKDRKYDIELNLNRAEPEERTRQLIATVPGVNIVESWKEQRASKARADGLSVERTYPDGGHGSATLITVPQQSKLIDLSIVSGRWLQDAGTRTAGKAAGNSGEDTGVDTVVLNSAANAYFSRPKVGDVIAVAVNGQVLNLRVAGIAREIMTGAHLYINQASYDKNFGAVGTVATTATFRVALQKHDPDSIKTITSQIELTLEKAGVATGKSITETMIGSAIDGHMAVLIVILLLMSSLMGAVGALGLASAMGNNVVERTREFGIMRTIGGRSASILRNVIGEGVFIGLMSWFIAILLAVPMAILLGFVSAGMNSNSAISFTFSYSAAALWLGFIIIIAIVASAFPARQAARLSIRDTMAFV